MGKRIHKRRGRVRSHSASRKCLRERHTTKPVIPAEAGIHFATAKSQWIPACVGMTAYCKARASLWLGFGVPAIAHAVHRVDAVERRVEGEKFPADALDVRGDGGIVNDDLGVAHPGVAILDVAGKASQRVDHPELGQREVDTLAVPLRREPLEIELQLAALDSFLDRLRRGEQVAASE